VDCDTVDFVLAKDLIPFGMFLEMYNFDSLFFVMARVGYGAGVVVGVAYQFNCAMNTAFL